MFMHKFVHCWTLGCDPDMLGHENQQAQASLSIASKTIRNRRAHLNGYQQAYRVVCCFRSLATRSFWTQCGALAFVHVWYRRERGTPKILDYWDGRRPSELVSNPLELVLFGDDKKPGSFGAQPSSWVAHFSRHVSLAIRAAVHIKGSMDRVKVTRIYRGAIVDLQIRCHPSLFGEVPYGDAAHVLIYHGSKRTPMDHSRPPLQPRSEKDDADRFLFLIIPKDFLLTTNQSDMERSEVPVIGSFGIAGAQQDERRIGSRETPSCTAHSSKFARNVKL